MFILDIHRGNIPSSPPEKKNLIFPPKKPIKFFVFGPRIIHCYTTLRIKLLFHFNNFSSRLPANSQHHIKYFNPQKVEKTHLCVIPRILSHHASKSVKAFDLCACLRKKIVKQKAFSFLGGFAPRPPDQRLCPWTGWGHSP